jgi:Uma2 family endonuclease
MSPVAPAIRAITADEFLLLPESPGACRELVRGEIEEMSLAGGEHGRIAARIGRRIGNHVEDRRLGETYAAETGFVTERDPDTVRGADCAFISAARLPLIADPRKHIRIPPDLVVEVTSPSDRPAQVDAKIAEWLAFGVRAVWQVDPDRRTVAVHRTGQSPVTLGTNGELDGGDILPGFRCRVADIFG